MNGDGKPDVIAGRNWFAAPDFKPRPLRIIEDWNGYVQSNGDFVMDVNDDGRIDVLIGSGWYEHPSDNPWGQDWKFHPDWDIQGSIPMIVRDVDRDGKNDLLVGAGHDYGLYWWR